MSEIIITNKMTSKYGLVAIRDCHVEVLLTVGNYKDSNIPVEIGVRGLKTSIKQVQLDVKHGRRNSVNVQIQPVIYNSIPVEIEVNPHNKMTARYELKEPPVSIYDELPVQDSFVTSTSPYNTINYGSNNSMIVGTDTKGDNTAYMKFDTKDIESNILVKTAKIKLYYTTLIGEPELVLNTVDKPWSEMGITYNNRPKNQYFITDKYTVNREARFIEFEVTDIVKEWVSGSINNGFSISSPDGASIFRTRETQLAPILTIEYYSSIPTMTKTSRKNVEITSKVKDSSSVSVELEVLAIFRFSTVPVEIHSHRIEDFYFSDKLVEIIANRNKVEVEIVASHKRQSTIDVQISCGISNASVREVEIEVPSYDRESIHDVVIAVQRKDESLIPVELTARRNFKNAKSTQDIEIIVMKSNESNVAVEIEAHRNYKDRSSVVEVEINALNVGKGHSSVEVQIEVPFFEGDSKVDIEIFCRGLVNSDKEVSIEVFRPYRYRDTSIEVEVRARALYISTIKVEIEVGETEDESYSYIYII